jgi:DNA-directed RNA polymerase subunit RPC12/RpoP
MISTVGHKRKSSSLDHSHINTTTINNNQMSTLTKRFRGNAYDGKINQNEHRMSLLSSKIKAEQDSRKMTIVNGEQNNRYKRLDESEMTPIMLTEYRRLQHELQCQEALLVLMQKLKSNQKLISQTTNNNNNNVIKQPTTATKLSQQSTLTDGKPPLTATKQPLNNSNRSIPTKVPHPNQYTVNRSNNNSQISQQQSSKNSLTSSQATRQSNNTNSTLPAAATRISSTVPTTATKNSSVTSTTNNSSKSNGVAAEQHLLNAKLALRKQLEQTLLQIPTPKPSTCDLTFIPGVNGWSEFLAYLGLEQALNTYTDIVNRRPAYEISMNLPYVCAQCGTDWSVTWHEMSSNSDTNSDDKIFCDRCTKTSQKKLLKQDHSNRLRQAFIKALQQEKELDAKFQQQSTSSPTTTTTPTPTSTVKQSSSSSSQPPTKHVHQTSKHSNKPLSTKTSSNHHHHHHHHNNNNNSTHNHNHHSHHHHHTGKSSSSKIHHTNPSTISSLTPSPAETLASTLAALQTNEQMEFFQKHFLSNMLPFAVANQTAAALAAKSTHQQQQQQAALAALPAMAASLMRQPNPAQYLLDMIPQAAKQQQQQQQHHHRHSK